MSMNGIDISNWQNGIQVNQVPCDFVICKATQGTTYVNPDCDRAYQQAKNAGKRWESTTISAEEIRIRRQSSL